MCLRSGWLLDKCCDMKSNVSKIFFIILTMGIFAAGGISVFVHKPYTFSSMENRSLTQFSDTEAGEFFSGKAQTTIADAIRDQFPLRDQCQMLAVEADRLMGADEYNGVYFGKDGYYIEKVTDQDVDLDHFKLNLRLIGKMKDDLKLKNADVLLVPSKGEVLYQKLPKVNTYFDWVPYYQAESSYDNLYFINSSALNMSADNQTRKDDDLYFFTDHHYTSRGAYLTAQAYRDFLRDAGYDIAETKLKDYGLKVASRDFLGTLYSRAPVFAPAYDTIELPHNLPDVTVSVSGGTDNRHEQGLSLDSETEADFLDEDGIYDTQFLNEKDKYSVYFGGNYGLVRIVNNNSEKSDQNMISEKDNSGKDDLEKENLGEEDSEKENSKEEDLKDKTSEGIQLHKIVIFKDSFANSAVPYLLNDVDETVMVDLRYYNGSVKELLQQEAPDRVLFFYEMTDFIKENNFSKLIR